MSNNESDTVKYASLRVREETSERLLRYIVKRMTEEGKRMTVDAAVNEALDAVGVE